MSKRDILKNLNKFRTNQRKRAGYLRDFERKMIYRTTKTENPDTTRKMVDKVLQKF